MNIKLLKRTIRRTGHRLGLLTDWEQQSNGQNVVGTEQPADWYDSAYAEHEGYHADYSQSCYYFSWSIIADRIVRADLKRVLEIGCGPGQFAALLRDQGIREYIGLDFSPMAIDMARQKAPEFDFLVGDARTSEIYQQASYDIIVCTEVLEHIEEDLTVVSRFPLGKRCICTVPNFPYESHVRHFKDASDVQSRYGFLFESLVVTTLKGSRSRKEEFFLFDGTRNRTIA